MKSYCEMCQQNTNHKEIHKHTESFREDYCCDKNYYIIQCEGCENISFRFEFDDIESGYPSEYDGWVIPQDIKTFPKCIENHKILDNLHYVPQIVKDTYLQTIAAYREGAAILAGLGFRAIIEAICNEQNIKGRNLEDRINKLCSNGIISKNNAKLLHAIRFLGNDAAHEIKNPSDKSLKVALNIVGHMIKSLYILDNEASQAMETVLETYEDFLEFIQMKLKNFKSGDEVPLAKILGKDIRRFADSLIRLEGTLIEEIRDGKYGILSLGKFDFYSGSKKKLQHYITK